MIKILYFIYLCAHVLYRTIKHGSRSNNNTIIILTLFLNNNKRVNEHVYYTFSSPSPQKKKKKTFRNFIFCKYNLQLFYVNKRQNEQVYHKAYVHALIVKTNDNREPVRRVAYLLNNSICYYYNLQSYPPRLLYYTPTYASNIVFVHYF